jgi:hypothetical protein
VVTKARPGAVKRCARSAKPYNTRLIALGLVADGLAVAWACLDGAGVINPAIYAAVSVLLKTANMAIHVLSKQPGSADDGESDDQ